MTSLETSTDIKDTTKDFQRSFYRSHSSCLTLINQTSNVSFQLEFVDNRYDVHVSMMPSIMATEDNRHHWPQRTGCTFSFHKPQSQQHVWTSSMTVRRRCISVRRTKYNILSKSSRQHSNAVYPWPMNVNTFYRRVSGQTRRGPCLSRRLSTLRFLDDFDMMFSMTDSDKEWHLLSGTGCSYWTVRSRGNSKIDAYPDFLVQSGTSYSSNNSFLKLEYA